MNRRHRVTASSWPMNAPKQTTLTASHGAPGFSLMTAGLGRSSKYFCKRTTGGTLPALTPDMPGAVLALAFMTRQTQGGGVVRASGSAARLEYAGKVPR